MIKHQSTAQMFEQFYGKPFPEITQVDLGPAGEIDWGEDVGNEEIRQMNDDAQKSKNIIIKWLEGKTKDKGLVPLWDNYQIALCDDELVEAYLKRLKNEKLVSAWNIRAFYLTEMLKRAEKTPLVDSAYGYIRDTVMHGNDDIEMLIRVAKDAQYRLDNKIGSSALPDISYSHLFINLAEYYKR